jgi:hypothetical protein
VQIKYSDRAEETLRNRSLADVYVSSMRHSWKWGVALGAVFVPASVQSASVPYKFDSATIDPTKLNANFDALRTAVTTLETARTQQAQELQALKARVALAERPQITMIAEVSYGANCGLPSSDPGRAKFRDALTAACKGKTACGVDFSFSYWGGSDPKPGTCKKEILVNYWCGQTRRGVFVNHVQTPQRIALSCLTDFARLPGDTHKH